MTIAGQKICIGATQCADQQFVPHWAAIDEEIHRHGGPARIGRKARKTGEAHPLAFRIDGNGVVNKISAHDLPQAFTERGKHIALLGLNLEDRPVFAGVAQ